MLRSPAVEKSSRNLPFVTELSRLESMNEVDACSTLDPSEPLSWQEICRLDPDQWVALVDIDWVDEGECVLRVLPDMGHVARIPSSRPATCTRATRRSVVSSSAESARCISATSRFLSRT